MSTFAPRRPGAGSWDARTARRSPAARTVDGDGGVVGRIAFLALAFGVPLTAWNAVRLTYSVTVGDAFLVVGAAATAVLWLGTSRRNPTVPGWLVAAALGLVVAGLLATFRTTPSGNLAPVVQFAGTMLVVPGMMALALTTARRIDVAVTVWLVAVSISVAVGLADRVGHLGIDARLTGLDFVLYTGRAPGLTLHPNHLGMTTAMALPVALARALSADPRRSGAFAAMHLGFAATMVLGIALSGSRAAVVGGVFGLVALAIFMGRRRRGTLVAGLVVVVGLGAVAVPLTTSGGNVGLLVIERLLGNDDSSVVSDGARNEVRSEAIASTKANPLVGVGFSVVREAHNVYLQLLQAGGVLALLAWMCFGAGGVLESRRLSQDANAPPIVHELAPALGAVIALWMVMGLAQNTVYDRYLYLPIGLLLACRALSVATGTPAGRPAGARTPDEDTGAARAGRDGRGRYAAPSAGAVRRRRT